MSSSETVTVTVAGPPAADAVWRPLTWAQANMWDAIWGYGTDTVDLPMLRRVVPAADLSLSAACEAVRKTFSRYEIARTLFDRATVRQRVLPRVDLEIPVVDAAGGEWEAATDRLLDSLRSAPFDHELEPPIRVGFVRDGARVRAIALALSHLAFDRHGVIFFHDAFDDVVRGIAAGGGVDGGGADGEGVDGAAPTQTGDVVAREASEALVARSRTTIDRWLAALAKLPPGRGIAPCAPGRYAVFGLRSAALAVGAQAIAERTRTSSGSVLLAALNLAVREAVAHPPAAVQVIVGNRHHGDLSGYAGIALQNGLCVLPPPAPFDDVVRKSHVAAMWGYLNSRYDTRALREAVFREQERGAAPDLSYFFNDMRNAANDWSGLGADGADLRTLRRAETDEPVLVGEHRVRDFTLFLHVLPATTTCSLRLICDDSVIDDETSKRILLRIRDLVVDAALAP